MRDDPAEIPVISAGDSPKQFWRWQGCPLFDTDLPVFALLTTALSTLQGALKDGFRNRFTWLYKLRGYGLCS